MDLDRDASIEALEHDPWGEAPADSSHLIRTVHAARRMPVGELTVDHLRMLIGQRLSLPIVVPLALEIIEREPLIEGDLYPGDLLAALMGLRTLSAAEQDRLRAVVARVDPTDPDLIDDTEFAALLSNWRSG